MKGTAMALIRLDKLLSNRSGFSRSEVKALLRQGTVQVDGVPEHDGARKLDPDVQRVTCQGKDLPGGTHLYYIVNKPIGYVCATEDRDHRIVTELLPKELRTKGLFPAGRLDIDSTGLVLLTDDGGLAHKMLSPKTHVPKYYLLRLARPWEEGYADKLRQGLALSDGTQCLPAEARQLEVPGNYALICLHEGRYHQVKRMMAALGNHVEHLHRVAGGVFGGDQVDALLLAPNVILLRALQKLQRPGRAFLRAFFPDGAGEDDGHGRDQQQDAYGLFDHGYPLQFIS